MGRDVLSVSVHACALGWGLCRQGCSEDISQGPGKKRVGLGPSRGGSPPVMGL